MIRAVIFDMDGLLIESEALWEQARRGYASDEGCTWRPEDELTVKGHNSPEWAHAMRTRCGWTGELQEIIDAVTARMRGQYNDRLPLLPGAIEVVRVLAELYPLAVASSSPSSLIKYAMSAAGVLDLFEVMVSADEAGRGKPAPDVFLAAAGRLGCPPETCAVFEDSSAGILAGRAAQMFVIAVPHPHYPPSQAALATADVVLQSLLEFQPLMLPRT